MVAVARGLVVASLASSPETSTSSGRVGWWSVTFTGTTTSRATAARQLGHWPERCIVSIVQSSHMTACWHGRKRTALGRDMQITQLSLASSAEMGGGCSASTCTVVAGQPVLSLGCRILRARPSTSPACASASLVRRGGSPDITAARIAIAAYAQRPRWRLSLSPPPWVGSLVGWGGNRGGAGRAR